MAGCNEEGCDVMKNVGWLYFVHMVVLRAYAVCVCECWCVGYVIMSCVVVWCYDLPWSELQRYHQPATLAVVPPHRGTYLTGIF